MIRTKHFTVKFQRNYVESGHLNKKGEPEMVPVSTTAIVSDNEGTVLSKGVALCGKEDIFTKEIGRKIAILRAVEERPAYFDKDMRKEILSAYFNRKYGKKEGSK